MEETIDLRECFDIIKKRAWIIVLITAIAVVISAVVSFFIIQPVYQSEVTFMVNLNKSEDAQITKDDMQYGTNLVEAYKPIVTSKKVTSTIKKNLNLDMSQGEIANSISLSSISGSVMSLKVNSTDAPLAAKIANEASEVFGKELVRVAKVDGIEIIDKASVATSPIKPNKVMNIAISAVLGIMISIFIIFLLEYLDNKVKTAEDIEKYLELNVLGIVSEFENKEKKKKPKQENSLIGGMK